ncbi:MAG TPA: sigma 54-interacting transcriptional regulator [Kofleriaceae bacterium]
MNTQTDVYGNKAAKPGRTRTMLYLALRAHDPMTASSRHVLDDIDIVQFGRGDDTITRDRHAGLRRLVIKVADPLMSSDHGRLVRVRDTWVLRDPDSKNGALVGGERIRSAQIADRQMFALGHTLFFLERTEVDDGGIADLPATALQPPVPELATFDDRLAASLRDVARVATTALPILISGETGTGKEVMAAAVHRLSERRGEFVAVNCGGLAPNLIEAELFGHRKGAFSGALADRVGYIRAADRGTLFLDEVAELPASAQAALLRVLQEREVVAVGDVKPVAVDLRICAATHRDVPRMIQRGEFREDLYARLLGLHVQLPPLHARRADLGMLIRALLVRDGASRVRFTPAAAIRLFEYGWPRNIRELDRALAIAVALADREPIDVVHLPPQLREPAPSAVIDQADSLSADELALKQQLEQLMRAHADNVAEVARRIGKDRTQIYRWLRRFGIQRD